MTQTQVLEHITLAQQAHGGEIHLQIRCECSETSIGTNPCIYCTVFYGLKHAKEFINDVIEANIVSNMIYTRLEDKDET